MRLLQITASGIPFIFTVAPTLITALDRQKDLTLIYTIGLFVNISANFILIRYFTSGGAAAAAVITYGYVFTASNIFLFKMGFTGSAGIIRIFIRESAITELCISAERIFLPTIFWPISLSLVSVFLYC